MTIRDKTILDGAEYSGISSFVSAYHMYGSFRDFGVRGLGFFMARSDVAAAALRHFQEQDPLVVSGSGLDSKDAMRAMIWGQIVGQGLISTVLPYVSVAEDVHSMVTGYQLGLRGQQEGKLSTTDRVLAGFNILCSAATTLKGMKNTPQFFNEPAIQKSLKALEFLQQTVNVGQPVTMMLVSASKNGWDHPDTLQAMFQLGHMGAMHFGQKHLVRRKKSNRFPKAGIPRKPGSNSEVIREGGPRWKQGKGRSPIPEDSRVPKNGTKKETAVIGKHPDTAPKKHQTPKRSTGPDHLETKPKSLKHGDHVVIDGKPGRWQVMEGEDGKVRVYRFDEYGTHVKLVDPAKLRHAPSAMSPKDVLKVRSFLKEMRNVDPALDGIARLFESGDLSVESVPLAQILKRWDSSGLHFPGSKRVKVGVLEHINDAKTDANIYRILEQIRRMNLPEGEVREFTRSIAAKVILAHELQHAAYQKEDFNKKLDAMRLDPKHPKLPHTTLAPSRQLRLNEYRSYRVEVQVERYLMWKAHERATEHWKSLGCPKGLEPRKPDYPPPGKDLGARWYQEIRRLSATHPEVQRLGQTEATMPLPKP